jgi:hypothetical protein
MSRDGAGLARSREGFPALFDIGEKNRLVKREDIHYDMSKSV